MKEIFNRGSDGRGASSPRGEFARVSKSSQIPFSTQIKVMQVADRVKAKVERHHAAHQAKWIDKRQTEILSKSGGTQRPAPLGIVNDPNAQNRAKASSLVAQGKSHRLARVEKARVNMMASGRLRPTRDLGWGKGLGE